MLLQVDQTHPHNHRWIYDMQDFEGIEDTMTASEFQLGEARQIHGRIRPDHKLFNELSLAMALAINRMPKLKHLIYRTDGFDYHSTCETSEFGFCCYTDIASWNNGV